MNAIGRIGWLRDGVLDRAGAGRDEEKGKDTEMR